MSNKKHTKEFGVYHWDTFDGGTFLLYEDDDKKKCIEWAKDHYGSRMREDGADRCDIVNSEGDVVEKFNVG